MIDMEDMCQLTLHPTEYKYKGSYEQIAKALARYSETPKLDLINYMQLLLFCFVTGNNDMHLKNFRSTDRGMVIGSHLHTTSSMLPSLIRRTRKSWRSHSLDVSCASARMTS